jgi:lysozyme
MQPIEALLIDHEGTGPVKNGRFFPYLDSVSKITIGCGRNLTDNGISDFERMVLLQDDVGDVDAALDKTFPWWRSLDPIRMQVLQDLVFNMGIYQFMQFADFIALVKAGAFAQAADDLDTTKYARQVGRRERHLAAMLRTGNAIPYASVT